MSDSSKYTTLDELRDDEHSLVAVVTSRTFRDRTLYSFSIYREFPRNGMTSRTTFLNPQHAEPAKRLIDRAVERIERAQ